ncbi:DUF1284 domain-containing protein [Candidatus Woesearchaeota archaeon]|jgi:uncharacterized protein|nr:DUF1284 domain-containing protein [Candidatus Woesearchaeota archaeon]MBT4388052.1 DUF1284 domain-containing protein [Candidatus Woesearchaeota archaeon]MBT4596317.1 DUF1284 domain-containing protein [Candidatus Woesearchaeota archaeon]MBT5740819.1 DUF1284 domain-containing protein [Candidatus Woesearchaeota archaeon]MBT6505319.1 DUF1284 domain-containing protein [Candidatus Woesearchaeota archaeon]
MKEPIEIRAHHILCMPRFYRGGYNTNFAINMKNTCQHIRNNPNTKIKVIVAELDVLCLQCPHKSNNKCVQSKKIGKWVEEQDRKVANFLDLKANSIHTAKDIFNLGMNKVNSKTMEQVCQDCIFLKNCMEVGVNNSFKKDLNKN